MLFGTSMYKLNKLNAEHQLTSVNMRLARAKKTIKNLQSAWTAEKNAAIAEISARKNSTIEGLIAQAMGTATDPGPSGTAEEKAAYNNALSKAQSQAYSEWSTYLANAKAAIESQYEETNCDAIQAAQQEEEDLTIESSYWQEMKDFWTEMIKQAEEWFRDSLQSLFGGGGRR